MYKIVVVEDERGERELICRIINELYKDFSVVADFGNGLDALEYITKNDIDVLLTDIKMPQMSGLDLINQIHQNNEKIKCIILSGYNEFEYARKAITYGVMNYLVKPIDVDELTDNFSRIKSILEYENEINQTDIPEISEEFFLDLCMDAIDDTCELYRRYSALNLPFSISDAYGFILKINLNDYAYKHKYTEEQFARSLTNIQKKFFGDYVYYFYSRESDFYFFVLNCDTSSLENIQKQLQSAFDYDIVLSFVSHFTDLENVDCDIFTLNDKLELLISHKLLNRKSLCRKLSQSIMRNISQSGKINFQSINSEILSVLGLDNIDSLLSKDINIRNFSDDNIIKYVEEYIENNFNSEISRDDIAHHVYMNPSYFSRFFKKKKNIGFYEYLLGYRVSKALELMKTNMSIEKISENTGFGNSKNFRRTFKLKTSYTPQEYRNEIINKSKEI